MIEVAIRPDGAPARYRVDVVRSPAGETSVGVSLLVGDLLARRPEVQDALLRSASLKRPPAPEIEESVREIGRTLFAALLGTDEVAGLYRAASALASTRGQRLRVLLRTDDPRLANLPWEAMYDKTFGYVCRQVQLVRHLPVPAVPPPLTVKPPLRILGVISSPAGVPALNIDRERELLTAALAPLSAEGLIDVTWLPDATFSALHELLMSRTWHVLHFIGHGSYSPDAGEGLIVLTGDDGRHQIIDSSGFADLLRRARPQPRLVVLNSCSGAASGTADLFAGTASALIRAGIPAVTAMQFDVSDNAASAFTRGFYTAIAHGRDVDDAVSDGRIAILGSNGRTLEWLTPALYMRGDQAQLFARA